MAGKILIYGGSGGIGTTLARELHARGRELHLVARDRDRLAAVAGDLNAGCTAGDVLDSELFSRVAAEAGDTLAGLVYAVGTIKLRSLQRLTPDDFLADYRVNALGAALAVQAALPALKRGGEPAAVVLFSSLAARQGFALHASLGMAKGAVSGLTLALAAELAPQVRVNAIAPSLTRTPLAAGIIGSDAMAAAIAGQHPLPRLGEAADIAQLAAFLLGPESGWITGQIFGVDGGRSTLRLKG